MRRSDRDILYVLSKVEDIIQRTESGGMVAYHTPLVVGGTLPSPQKEKEILEGLESQEILSIITPDGVNGHASGKVFILKVNQKKFSEICKKYHDLRVSQTSTDSDMEEVDRGIRLMREEDERQRIDRETRRTQGLALSGKTPITFSVDVIIEAALLYDYADYFFLDAASLGFPETGHGLRSLRALLRKMEKFGCFKIFGSGGGSFFAKEVYIKRLHKFRQIIDLKERGYGTSSDLGKGKIGIKKVNFIHDDGVLLINDGEAAVSFKSNRQNDGVKAIKILNYLWNYSRYENKKGLLRKTNEEMDKATVDNLKKNTLIKITATLNKVIMRINKRIEGQGIPIKINHKTGLYWLEITYEK